MKTWDITDYKQAGFPNYGKKESTFFSLFSRLSRYFKQITRQFSTGFCWFPQCSFYINAASDKLNILQTYVFADVFITFIRTFSIRQDAPQHFKRREITLLGFQYCPRKKNKTIAFYCGPRQTPKFDSFQVYFALVMHFFSYCKEWNIRHRSLTSTPARENWRQL